VNTVLYVLEYAIIVYIGLIVARALLSWFPLRRGTALMRLYEGIYGLTEPYLSLFRRVIPPSRTGSIGIDWSTLAGTLVLYVVLQILARL
jgi:uncharacterized protein YggT (Ycf19 family)